MSIISVNEKMDERRASVKDGKRTYSTAYLVRTDDPRDTQAMVLFASGVPRYRQPFSDDNDALCSSVDIEPHDNSPKHWTVRVDFSAADAEQVTLHPLARPADFTYGNSDFSETYFIDETTPKRRTLVNTAGDPFEQAGERTRSELTITMTRNEASFSPVDADYYANTTNEAATSLDGHAYAPDTLLMSMATASKEREQWMGTTVTFYKVTRPFRARREGWKDTFLSVGYNQLATVPSPSGGPPIKQKVPIMDGAGLRASRPWPIGPSGVALPDPSGTPVNCEFRPYRSISWNSLIGNHIGFSDMGEQDFSNLDPDLFGGTE